ncbi:heptaprenylglyceryl phosphate synthase [Chryseomicrobium sp. FSL W7-1435]|uniref:heptaprenylglyceryl phosphate synthase n=1 Tax=Chryseomicrobium sp. FSL W7-1435 TaxID=2921704 RepID=UPI00315A8E9E
MLTDFHEWKHVFKLDPAKSLTDEQLEQICESGTDALIVGGSDNIELDDVLELLMKIRRFALPVCLELSTLDMITPGFDYYLIPSVLNSPHTQWVKDLHHQALVTHGDFMNWDEVFVEGYCILNPDAKVAHLTEAETSLSTDEVVAYARLAENLFRLPIFYLEYSGMFGDPQIVKASKQVLSTTRLFYGGGIETPEQARQMALYADTIIVGNSLYTNLKQALATVKAVKEEL